MLTNETRIVKPSINMLPIQEIEEALNGVVDAHDTSLVGGVDAYEIAKAYNGNREAVKTAYFLGERPAEEYLTTDKDPTKEVNALKTNHETEITALRLELYRLYEILNKQLGATYKPESGYLEDFIETVTATTTATVVNAGSFITELRPQQADFALSGEYIVIDDGQEQYVAQIESISNQVYVLKGSISSAVRNVTLYKIKGEMLKNTYSFSRTTKDVLADYQHSVLLGDYTNDTMQAVDNGCATNIVLRSNMLALDGDRDKAVLSSIRAFISRTALQASPQLTCKVYLIERYTEEKPVLKLIGASKEQSILTSKWVTFEITNQGQPLEVLKNQEILVAFECNGANDYKILMGQGTNNDLHTNRSIFHKVGEGYEKTESVYDILIGLNFSGYVAEATTPYTNGLYTSHVFVNEKDTNSLAQLQVKLKNINKAIVQSHTPVDGFGGFVVNKQILGTGAMVVGNNIAHYVRGANNTIFTDEHIAVYPGDEVYFIPLKAQLTTVSELFEENTVKQVVPMLPVRVTADYLIFECKLPEHVKRFQAQIAYEDTSNAQAAALESIAVSLI